MKLELFKPEDFKQDNAMFEFILGGKPAIEKTRAAEIANKILNDYIETLPKVYGGGSKWKDWGEDKLLGALRVARLICIEEIKPKEPCKHERFFMGKSVSVDEVGNQGSDGNYFLCLDCNKTLKPNWTTDL